MLRTQVSLDEQDYKSAKKEAAAWGISLAEYVRRATAVRSPPRDCGNSRSGCATPDWSSRGTRSRASRLTRSFMATKTVAYVDTSALIAFLDRSDSFHPLFRRLFSWIGHHQ